MRLRLIMPNGGAPIIEKDLSEFKTNELKRLNEKGYQVYYYPNGTTKILGSKSLNGTDVDVFEWVFIDMDLKDGIYSSKEDFFATLSLFPLKPTKIVDSGHGIHSYWKINNLTRNSLLDFQYRLIQKFNTDKSLGTVAHLMRLPGYLNTKSENKEEWVLSLLLEQNENSYSVEEFSAVLPPLSAENATKIARHLEKLFGEKTPKANIHTEDIPEKFRIELENSPALQELFLHPKDRSKADMKLANILYMKGYSKDEAFQVLCHTLKGQERGTEYAESTLNRAYNTPLSPLDTDYEQCKLIATNQHILKKKQEEIFEYELEQKYQKTLKKKELDKKKGVYTLRGTTEFRKQKYEQDIQILENAIQNRLFCVTPKLTDLVPLLGVELILIGAKSGAGKSSTVTALTVPLIEQGKRVLILSNEERGSDFLMRIASIRKGINVNDRNIWTTDTFKEIRTEVNTLTEMENLMIVDNYVPGADLSSGREIEPLDLTNLDQLKTILESVERDGMKFDLMILDYISKVGTSDEKENEWQVLYKAIKFIEEWGKRNATPSVVFTQLKEVEQGTDQSFKARLPGSKRMYDAVTNAIEIQTDYDTSESIWVCHKLRYGLKFRHILKFHKGKYFDME